MMMFMYSALLVLINRQIPTGELRIGGVRLVMMMWSFALFGTLSELTVIDQYKDLTG